MPGEATFAVPSLALPEPSTSIDLDAVAAAEAVRLFVERAVDDPAVVPPRRLERGQRRRDLPAARRHPARARARRGAGQRPVRRGDRAGPRRPLPPPDRRSPDRRPPPADPAGAHRLELGPAERGRPAAAPPAVGVRRAAGRWRRRPASPAIRTIPRRRRRARLASRPWTASAASSIAPSSWSPTPTPPATGCSRRSASTRTIGWSPAARRPTGGPGTLPASGAWRSTRRRASPARTWSPGWAASRPISTTCERALDWAYETDVPVALEMYVALGAYWRSRSLGSEGVDRMRQALDVLRRWRPTPSADAGGRADAARGAA